MRLKGLNRDLLSRVGSRCLAQKCFNTQVLQLNFFHVVQKTQKIACKCQLLQKLSAIGGRTPGICGGLTRRPIFPQGALFGGQRTSSRLQRELRVVLARSFLLSSLFKSMV